MVGFLLKCSLAELLSQVVPIENARYESISYLFRFLLVLLYQLCSFIQKLINAVGRCSTGETKYIDNIMKTRN